MAPMLATAGPLPTHDDGWAYEFKWDGVRALTYVTAGTVRAFSRTGKELTKGFPELDELGAVFGDRDLVLDGELVAFDDAGRPNFGRLQHRLNLTSAAVVARRAAEITVTYLGFDLLRLDGNSMLDQSYDDRRIALASLDFAATSCIVPPAFSDAAGADVLAAATSAGLEGVVAKRRDSRYRPGERSPQWVKIKIVKTQEVVLGGWTDGEGARRGSLGAILLGVNDDGGMRFAGKVGTGFDAATRRELLAALEPLMTAESPFVAGAGEDHGEHVHYVRPELVGEVRFAEWTAAGHLRHTSWRGLRLDKIASEVVREP